jgi:hypothetical protein
MGVNEGCRADGLLLRSTDALFVGSASEHRII